MSTPDWRNTAALRFRDTARLLSVSERTLYQRAKDGKVPTVTVLGLRRIPTEWVRAQIGEAVSPPKSVISAKIEAAVDDLARDLGL